MTLKVLTQRSMPPGEDTGPESEYCATCRPCCTIPHGPVSVTTAVLATIAFIFSLMTAFGCQFMRAEFHHCVPPPLLLGTCGDCHCIIEGENSTCPKGDAIPRGEFYQETVDQWKDLKHLTPMTLDCNPYKNRTCTTQPPQDTVMLDLWEDAVCGIKYNMDSLDPDNQCPTEYETIAYANLTMLEADEGAELTHYGTCGVCSSLQDLAVYVENPDLTGQGQQCGVIGLLDEPGAVKCFMNAGYSEPCATMWTYNTIQTREKCFDVCVDFTFEGHPNNGPPPICDIAPCLQCDEDYSGPLFKPVAARTRRRSGLLSKIARPCDDILLVNHKDPCSATSGTTEIEARTKQEPKCLEIDNNVGPLYYASKGTQFFLDLGILASNDQAYTRSQYNTCTKYDMRRAVSGFWVDVGAQLGAAWRASAAFTLIATILGSVAVVLTWSTTCAAYRQNFWTAMVWSYWICGVCQLLILVFFASDVCPDGGCEFLSGATYSIIAGIFWFLTSFFASIARGPAKPDHIIGCCCCLDSYTYLDNSEEGQSLLVGKGTTQSGGRSLLAGKGSTQITVTESTLSDGTKLTEKVTVTPDGRKTIERVETRNVENPEQPAENPEQLAENPEQPAENPEQLAEDSEQPVEADA